MNSFYNQQGKTTNILKQMEDLQSMSPSFRMRHGGLWDSKHRTSLVGVERETHIE